ncbi:proximal tail sheath stabilization [Prochlorococcus phage P-SSM2]|jgi:hypothetical protein|uniref:Proximal tail sheath stabilization n=2 Tax=Salacisavirus pssm2 TaxID=2734140 RepID=Q58MN2_BPPRM|nr:tail sheath stabilizer [Prochlorococcus phage P-SSM2]AAX44500.1 proximal tail sheath stabilization [Prochlorococcus phage P-SSM2]ACY76001.1 tail sheath stabilizer [Prochlorococcus phage P-SSM2]AGN12466.1 tail sheath stabilizer [Prochlorococcus phage P-SSM5]
MLGTYFYHEIIRKTVIAFGTLFNEVHVRHQDAAGKDISDIKVPISYGPKQKFLARIQQQPDLNKAVQITLPRMSFEVSNIQYDPSRKAGITQTFKAQEGAKLKKVFMPVPYNLGFELNILTKLQDDSMQILEQILPFFQPGFTLTIDLAKSIGEKRDVPMVLDSITFSDDYEGNFETRRALIYTLNFTAKTYMFGPIADSTEGLIRKVQVDYYSDSNTQTAKREQRYTVKATAKKDYNEDSVIDQYDDPLIPPGDDFGFTETSTFYGDGKEFSPTRKVDL